MPAAEPEQQLGIIVRGVPIKQYHPAVEVMFNAVCRFKESTALPQRFLTQPADRVINWNAVRNQLLDRAGHPEAARLENLAGEIGTVMTLGFTVSCTIVFSC